MSRREDVDGVVFVLYGFLVLCSSSFSFMEFVQSSSAVFFKAISQPPSLTGSEFNFLCSWVDPLYLGPNMA